MAVSLALGQEEDPPKKKNEIKVDELDVWLSMVAEARRAETEAKIKKPFFWYTRMLLKPI